MDASWERISSKLWVETNILTRNGVEGERCTFTWVYNCGWKLKGEHPDEAARPIGLLSFYKESGILPK